MLISVGELISKSFAFAKEHWQKYVPYIGAIVAFSLASGLLQVYAARYGQGIALSLLLLVISIGSIIVSLIVSTAMIILTKKLLDKQSVPEGLFNDAKKLIGPVFIASFLVGLIVLGGTILLIIPGIIFAVWYAFATYEVIIENKRGMEALGASKKLVSGRWWSILWRFIGPALPLLGVMIVVGIVVGIIAAVFDSLIIEQIIMLVVQSALYFFILPYSIASQTMLYMDAKAKPVTTTAPTQK